MGTLTRSLISNPPADPSSTRVLVVGDGIALAHAGRALVFARHLHGMGYTVDYASTAKYCRQIAAEEPFPTHSLPGIEDTADGLSRIKGGGHIYDRNIIEAWVASERDLIRQVGPHIVVGDLRLTLAVSAELEGVERHSILNTYLTKHGQEAFHCPETMPGTVWLRRAGLGWMFPHILELGAFLNLREFRKILRHSGNRHHRVGLFQLVGSRHWNYVADANCLNPLRPDAPTHFESIGPIIWEPDPEQCPAPDWLPTLDHSDHVYVSFGSSGDPADTVRALDVVTRDGRSAIATYGSNPIQPQPGVHAVGFIRPSQVLQRCSAVVCHGGNGTIYQALLNGLPVIAIPPFYDQEHNAAQLARRGLGVALRPSKWNDEDLRQALARLRDGNLLDRVRRAQAELRKYPLVPTQGCRALQAA